MNWVFCGCEISTWKPLILLFKNVIFDFGNFGGETVTFDLLWRWLWLWITLIRGSLTCSRIKRYKLDDIWLEFGMFLVDLRLWSSAKVDFCLDNVNSPVFRLLVESNADFGRFPRRTPWILPRTPWIFLDLLERISRLLECSLACICVCVFWMSSHDPFI